MLQPQQHVVDEELRVCRGAGARLYVDAQVRGVRAQEAYTRSSEGNLTAAVVFLQKFYWGCGGGSPQKRSARVEGARSAWFLDRSLAGLFEGGHVAVCEAYRNHETFSDEVSEEGLDDAVAFRLQKVSKHFWEFYLYHYLDNSFVASIFLYLLQDLFYIHCVKIKDYHRKSFRYF